MPISTVHRIICRSRVSDHCLNRHPTSAQFSEDLPQSEDATYERDSGTIICDPCYMKLVAAG